MTAAVLLSIEEQLHRAADAHREVFESQKLGSIELSPWYPTLLKVFRLVVEYFISDKSPASVASKKFARSQLESLKAKEVVDIDIDGLEPYIFQIAYSLIDTLIESKYVIPLKDFNLLIEIQDDDKVNTLVADNEEMIDIIQSQIEELIYGVIDHLNKCDEGKALLSEIEVKEVASQLELKICDDIDNAIIEQLLALAYRILGQDDVDSTSLTPNSQHQLQKDGDGGENQDLKDAKKVVEETAMQHVLILLEQVLEQLKNDGDVWDQVRSVCIDKDVSPVKLQGTLFATVNYALAQVFKVLPTDEADFRRKFADFVKQES